MSKPEDIVDVEFHEDGSETIHEESDAGTTQAYREWIGRSDAVPAEVIAAAKEAPQWVGIDKMALEISHAMCGEPGFYCPTGEHEYEPLWSGGSY